MSNQPFKKEPAAPLDQKTPAPGSPANTEKKIDPNAEKSADKSSGKTPDAADQKPEKSSN